MKIAIVYESMTGNTKAIAGAIQEALSGSVIYFGTPEGAPDADFYFVGSWTDKGTCCAGIANFLKSRSGCKIAYFATAGFGGSEAYYQSILTRVKSVIPAECELVGNFFCPGRMPQRVRDRYAALLRERPGDEKLTASIRNFDTALPHPDNTDLQNAAAWARGMIPGTACGINCCDCPSLSKCGGCNSTNRQPFGGECVLAACCRSRGYAQCSQCGSACTIKQQLIAEFNALTIPDMPEITDLNALCGAYINLEYSLPSGQTMKLWDDTRVYLGNQVRKVGSNRCYGLTADEHYLLVCEYGENGADPEIVVYKRRK